MIGKKEQTQNTTEVPVYTVHTVPRPYEIIAPVFADNANRPGWDTQRLFQELGKAGAAVDADAVIGVAWYNFMKIVQISGTAIRYLDKE